MMTVRDYLSRQLNLDRMAERGLGIMLLSFLIVVLTLFILSRLFRAIFDPLRHVPGPKLARFTRFWYLKNVYAGDFEKTNLRLHDAYGKIVRIAPREYSINDEESWKVIYGHATGFTKAPWYKASGNPDPSYHDLFTDRDPKRHAAERRKVANLYSMTSLIPLEPYVETCTTEMLERFDQFSQSNVQLNMQHWLQCYAFDLIGLITLNKRFGFLDSGEDKGGLLAALHQYLSYAASVGVYSEWHRFLSRLLALLPASGMEYLFNFTQAQLQERLSGSKDKKTSASEQGDFLTRLLKMHDKDPETFTMKDVFAACITNIGAGSDTTSISLSAILYYLIKNPEALAKLRKEISEHCSDSGSLIKFKQAQAMPFLQACIKEALRLHPATGLPLARVTPANGTTLCGQYFPAGTIVGVNTWVAHRNKHVFGDDANEFRPERWLEDPTKASTMERSYMPFGLGSRTCIGKNISLLEISKLIPEIVRRYDFQLVDSAHRLETENVWFVKQKNFFCTIKRRVVD